MHPLVAVFCRFICTLRRWKQILVMENERIQMVCGAAVCRESGLCRIRVSMVLVTLPCSICTWFLCPADTLIEVWFVKTNLYFLHAVCLFSGPIGSSGYPQAHIRGCLTAAGKAARSRGSKWLDFDGSRGTRPSVPRPHGWNPSSSYPERRQLAYPCAAQALANADLSCSIASRGPTTATVLAETSVRSPRRLSIFIIWKRLFWIKVSKNIIYLILKTDALDPTASGVFV